MAQQFRIVGIKKPGGSDNHTTHITDVLVEGPIYPNLGILGSSPLILSPLRGLQARPYQPPTQWRTVEAVIADIEVGNEYYYTDKGDKRADVMVVSPALRTRLTPSAGLGLRPLVGRKHIKTRADFTTVDNLLSLPNYYGK